MDEIQELHRGLASLKYFCENAREYHVAVAGSLLGLALHQGESYPVGQVHTLEMYPMTFEEFL
jgi:Predicted ATPase (AAA+ superfamily)